jgi:hypothetical protein
MSFVLGDVNLGTCLASQLTSVSTELHNGQYFRVLRELQISPSPYHPHRGLIRLALGLFCDLLPYFGTLKQVETILDGSVSDAESSKTEDET